MNYAHEAKSYERKLPKGVHASMPKLDASLWPEFDTYLLGRGLDPAIAHANRWYPSRHAGDPRDGVPGLPRIVMLGTNSSGFVYWQARAMVPTDKRYWSPSVQRMDSAIIVYPDTYARLPVVVVEGPMDALAAACAGHVGIALMGKQPPYCVLDFIASVLQRQDLLVIADRDSPADAACTLAYLASKGRRCKLLLPPSPYKDLCDMPIKLRAPFLAKGFGSSSK